VAVLALWRLPVQLAWHKIEREEMMFLGKHVVVSKIVVEHLKTLKTKTGVPVPVLARLALTCSMREGAVCPPQAIKSERGMVFETSVLLGEYALLYEWLLKEGSQLDHSQELGEQLVNHLDRGLKYLKNARNLVELLDRLIG